MSLLERTMSGSEIARELESISCNLWTLRQECKKYQNWSTMIFLTEYLNGVTDMLNMFVDDINGDE